MCVHMCVVKDDIKCNILFALAGVAQWIECQPTNQRVTGSIPSIQRMPGLRARSPVRGGGHERGNHTLMFLFLSFSLLSLL